MYIFCDGPKKNATKEEIDNINKVKKIVSTQHWCSQLTLHFENENKGLSYSIINGVTDLLMHHKCLIILEDDILTGKGFLNYMNTALQLYENEKDVISIHARNYSINHSVNDSTFFLRGADCWGWATWSDRWKLFESDPYYLYQQIENRSLKYLFNMDDTIQCMEMLKNQMDAKIDSWAIRWHASAFLLNKLTLHPKISLVYNIGLDGSGTHNEINQSPQFYTDFCELKKIPVKENEMCRKEIIDYHSASNKKVGFINSLIIKVYNKIFNILLVIRFFKSKNVTEHFVYSGQFSNWNEAKKNSLGYETDEIMEKCRSAILKVKKREAIYERDSVLFDKAEYAWPLLASLQYVSLYYGAKLNVIDYGGSFGTTYFQHKVFLDKLNKLNWIVVEQEKFVDASSEISDEYLNFSKSIDNCSIDFSSSCLLLSGVLQYLEDPYNFIKKIHDYHFPFIIIDRTSFIKDKQRLTVQHVPDFIYNASYPCWFFCEHEFLDSFSNSYDIVSSFNGFAEENIIADDGKELFWKGYFLKLREKK